MEVYDWQAKAYCRLPFCSVECSRSRYLLNASVSDVPLLQEIRTVKTSTQDSRARSRSWHDSANRRKLSQMSSAIAIGRRVLCLLRGKCDGTTSHLSRMFYNYAARCQMVPCVRRAT